MAPNSDRTLGGPIIAAVLTLAIGLGVYLVVRLLDNVSDPGGDIGGLGMRFRYDFAKYRKVDPKLIICEEVTSDKVKIPLVEPRGIAVGPDGGIYVVGDQNLLILTPRTGSIVKRRLSASPRCLAVGPDGNIYVGMTDHVQVFSSTADMKTRWDILRHGSILTSIAVTDEHVFVADAGGHVVLRYNKFGKLLGRIGRKDSKRNIPGFVIPSAYFDIAMAADGLLRVANPGMHRIEGYTVDGDFELEPWGKNGTDIDKFCGCCNPVNFALLPDGSFVTVEKGLTRVKIYDPEGRFVGVVAAPKHFSRHDEIGAGRGSDSGGLDVAVDARGRILILDPFTSEVRVFIRKKTRGADNE